MYFMLIANFIIVLKEVIPMNKSRRIIIEKKAEEVRNLCKITDYGIHNIFNSLEKIGYELIRYPLDKNGLLGFSQIKKNGRIIFSNSSVILSREIYTVAHELGHHVLHLSSDGITLIKDKDLLDKDEREIEANYFAACFLMPREEVYSFIRYELNDKPIEELNGLDIAMMQTTFNVSYETVLNRLNSIGIINDEKKVELETTKKECTVSLLLRVINGNIDLCKPSQVKSIPAKYLKWVIYNYNERLIPIESVKNAFKYFNINIGGLDINNCYHEKEVSIEELLNSFQ